MTQPLDALQRARRVPALVAETRWFSSVGTETGRNLAADWAEVYLEGIGLPQAECRWAESWEEARAAAACLRQSIGFGDANKNCATKRSPVSAPAAENISCEHCSTA